MSLTPTPTNSMLRYTPPTPPYAAGADQRGAVNEAELQKARDEELEACLWHLESTRCNQIVITTLRAARRPKPPSLKEQALAALGPCPEARPLRESDPGYPTCGVIGNAGEIENWKTIRAALEALND